MPFTYPFLKHEALTNINSFLILFIATGVHNEVQASWYAHAATDGYSGSHASPSLIESDDKSAERCAIVAYFTLPDYPEKGTRWLKGNQKLFAQYRLSKDHGAVDENPNLLEGAKMAAKDPM